MIKVKAFIEAIDVLIRDVEKGKKYLDDNRLTQSEKNILLSLLHIRDNKTQIAIDMLNGILAVDPIVDSQKNVLLGIAYNNQGHFLKAIKCFESSLGNLQKYGTQHLNFVTVNNMFIAFYNLRDAEGMEKSLKRLKEINTYNDISLISLLRAEFNFRVFHDEYQEAEKVMNKLDKMKSKMTESQVIGYLIDKFRFFIKLDNFNGCNKILTEMKGHRKFHLSSNYNFMKQLLKHLADGKPLYVVDSDFVEYPNLYYQMKVIEKLEETKVDEAQMFWQKLHEGWPELHGKDLFDYKGDKCLFSLCLDKHQQTSKKDLSYISLPESKVEAFGILIEEAKAPLHQELIYQMLWKELPQEKSDLNKLAQIVSAYRRKSGQNVKLKKGCYFIEFKPSLKKA